MADKPEREIDEDLVHQLTRLLDETGLTEIEYGRDGWHIRVAKGGIAVSAAAPAASPPAADLPSSPEEPIETANAVTSPMVGVVFTSSDPETPPFVKVGQAVTPETIVCIVEAMKVFNQIPAETAGTIVELLVENGDAIEFGQPLFRIQPA